MGRLSALQALPRCRKHASYREKRKKTSRLHKHAMSMGLLLPRFVANLVLQANLHGKRHKHRGVASQERDRFLGFSHFA